jgi:shikimate kinase
MSNKKNLVQMEGAKLNENRSFKFSVENIEIKKEKKHEKKIFWIDKYCPSKTSEITSNKDEISYIKKWLCNFHKNKAETNSCIVIMGLHGIGKTLIAKLLAEEAGYNTIYFNSYTSKKEPAITSRIMKFYRTKGIVKKKRNCVIIDESETISLTSEKNAISDMYKENNIKKYFPLIFITTNTQHNKFISDIQKFSLKIHLKKPESKNLKNLLIKIEKNENFKLENDKARQKIIDFCQSDYRRFLIILQDLYFTYNKNLITYKNTKTFIGNNKKKSEEISLFDATKIALEKYSTFSELQTLYMNEKVLLPLMIHENYINFMFSKYDSRNNDIYIKIMRDISNSISWGDVIETSIYTDQNWFLQENIHAFYTTINISFNLNKYAQNKSDSPLISFSSDLNKTSLKNINRKNISLLKHNMPNKNLNDLIYMNNIMSNYIINKEYDKVKQIKHAYGLSIKDIEIILKLNKIREKITLTSKMKKLIN